MDECLSSLFIIAVSLHAVQWAWPFWAWLSNTGVGL